MLPVCRLVLAVHRLHWLADRAGRREGHSKAPTYNGSTGNLEAEVFGHLAILLIFQLLQRLGNLLGGYIALLGE